MAAEIEWCEEFFKQHPRWRIMNVSNKAIEEISASILNAYKTGGKPT
ncbi:MAG: kinase/pyrophosphorylase [Nitrospirota bacterium]